MKHFKIYLIITVSVFILLIVVPTIGYIINFWGTSISKNSSDWGTFGDYFGGILNPVIGITNIIGW